MTKRINVALPVETIEVLDRLGPKGNRSRLKSGLAPRAAVLLNQIRSVDRQRLGKRLSHAGPKAMARVGRAIQISLGLTTL